MNIACTSQSHFDIQDKVELQLDSFLPVCIEDTRIKLCLVQLIRCELEFAVQIL